MPVSAALSNCENPHPATFSDDFMIAFTHTIPRRPKFIYGTRWITLLRLARFSQRRARRTLCRSDIEGRKASGLACRTHGKHQAGGERQDGQGAWDQATGVNLVLSQSWVFRAKSKNPTLRQNLSNGVFREPSTYRVGAEKAITRHHTSVA